MADVTIWSGEKDTIIPPEECNIVITLLEGRIGSLFSV